MARYEHLPIYKKAMDLTIYFEKIVRNFSRYHKYTLGTELRQKSLEIVGLIIKANSTVERLPLLLELREKLEGLQVLLRICKEVRAFNSFNSYVYGSKIQPPGVAEADGDMVFLPGPHEDSEHFSASRKALGSVQVVRSFLSTRGRETEAHR